MFFSPFSSTSLFVPRGNFSVRQGVAAMKEARLQTRTKEGRKKRRVQGEAGRKEPDLSSEGC